MTQGPPVTEWNGETETPVLVIQPGGPCVHGILHPPSNDRGRRIGVCLLNPGLKSRVAPNRLNVLAARRLAALGYWVLRVDPPGVGDSDGQLPEEALPTLWQEVQQGAFVDAVRQVFDRFSEECALDEVVGMGNCGGAITALLAARGDRRVRRLVLIDLPVTLRPTGAGANLVRIHGREHGTRILSAYARRALDWRAWVNLLRFRTRISTVARALGVYFRPVARAQPVEPAPGGAGPRLDAGAERLSEPFIRALSEFHDRGGEALFVTAANDDNTFAFDSHFGRTFLAPGTELARRHRRVMVPGSNHIYGTPEWREELLCAVVNWLRDGEHDSKD